MPGVSNRSLGPDDLDTPADFEHLQQIGAGLGSAGFNVDDDRRSAACIAQLRRATAPPTR